jgi:DNA-binding phage protein
MTRLVLAALLLAAVSAQAQTYLTRAELKKPLSEGVEKALAEFVDQCAVEKQKQLSAHMEEVIKAVHGVAKLSDEEKKALQQPMQRAVQTAVKNWKPQAVVAMRTYLSRTSETAARRHVSQWKPEQAGLNEPVEDWTPPQDDAGWIAALKQTLGEDRFKRWEEADAKERKKTDEEIHKYLERWVRESRGPMNEDLQAKIEQMKTKLALPEERVAALKKTAESLLDQITDVERKRAAAMLRTLTPESRQNITGRSYFYVRFDRPRGEAWEKRWQEAVAKVLPAAMIAEWSKTSAEERGKAESELADMIKPSEIYLRQQMEMALITEIDSITSELGLEKERQDRLKKLSDEAVEESLKLARKQWLQQARNYSAAERQRMRANTYFGLNEEQQAMNLPFWKDGVKRILSEAERTRMSTENDQREKRALAALAAACLAEMDRVLMLNDDQRTKLEPLLTDMMKPLMEQRRGQYWSHSPQQLFQAAGKLKQEQVSALLDEAQQKHWKDLVSTTGSSSARVAIQPGGTSPEVPDMEAAISAHLYKMFVAERKKVLAVMMPHVEEAKRVLALPDDAVSKLTTAAKGAVEESLQYWRQNTERYVRQNIQAATAKNILQALAGTERVNFSRNDGGPQEMEIWKNALQQTLDKAQLGKLEKAAQARRDHRLKAMAAMTISELDRRRRLTGEQCAKLEPLVRKVLTEYQPDIERYMSGAWFLQYYYALVPVAGVPEKEMQAILPASQWKLCKERDLPDAMQYWEGIENYHKNRLKNGGNGNANRVFFNGGLIIDE